MYIRAERKATGRRPKVGNPKVGNGAESSLLELCRDAKEENSKLLNAGRKYLWTTAILSPKIIGVR